MKKLFVVCVVAIAGMVKTFAGIIPPDRMINWIPGVTVGVQGTIPLRTNIIDVTQPPYSADNTGAKSAAAAVQAAINAATNGQVVYCPPGTYDITAGVTLNRNGITLRGGGPNTVFVGSLAVGVDPSPNYALGYALNIASGANKFSTNLTFVNAVDPYGSHVSVGDSFSISSTITGNDQFQFMVSSGGDAAATQAHLLKQPIMITSVSGNSCTFTPPLVWDFTNSPVAAPLNLVSYFPMQMRYGVGLENFTLTTTNASLISSPTFMLKLSMLFNSWVTGCNFYNGLNYNVYFEYCIGCTFDHNQVRFSRSSGSNHAGLLTANDSGCLIEDNVFADGLEPGMEWNDGFCGNATFANFFTNNLADVDMHNTHPVMNLWEENVAGSFEVDGYFGSCSHQTLFRNRLYGTAAFKRWSTYMQVVGNVLGNTSIPFIYYSTNSNYPGTEGWSVLEFGYPNIGNTTFNARSGPVPYNYPGGTLVGFFGENLVNGSFVITNTQLNTNVIFGNFTNIPGGNAFQYPLIGQDPDNTNIYHLIGTPAAAPTASSITLSTSTTVSNGWRVFMANQNTYQWLQTSNLMTDIVTGNAVCTNQSTFTVVWDANGAQTLDASLLYPSGPPTWWGTNRWPGVDPLNSVPAVLLPSQDKYLGIPTKPRLAPPSGLKLGT
jgi:hypothetical protein